MKKFSIYLLSLSLLGPMVQSLGATSYALEQSERVVWMGENTVPSYFKVNDLLLSTGSSGSAVYFDTIPKNSSENVLGMYFLTYDYKHGVTEEVANQEILKFQGEQADWVANMAARKWENDLTKTNGAVPFSSMTAMTDQNLTGIMYYALEVGTMAQQTAEETKWVMGRLNYRACLHDFWGLDEPRVSSCGVTDLGGGRISFYNSTVSGKKTTDEELPDWKEEWGDILLKELEELDDKFESETTGEEELGKIKEEVEKIKTRVEEIKDLAPTTDKQAEIEGAADELLEKIRKWQDEQKETESSGEPSTPNQPTTPESGDGEDGEGENEEDGDDVGKGNTGGGDGGGDTGKGGTGSAGDNTENGNSSTGSGSGNNAGGGNSGAGSGNDDASGGVGSSNGDIIGGGRGETSDMNGVGGTVGGDVSNGMGSGSGEITGAGVANGTDVTDGANEDETEDVEDNQNDTNKTVAIGEMEEIEVPQLSGKKSGWNIWPLILIGLAILLTAFWCGKKWRESRNKIMDR